MGATIPKNLLTDKQKEIILHRVWWISGGDKVINRYIHSLIKGRFGSRDQVSIHSYMDLLDMVYDLPVFINCRKCKSVKPRDKVIGEVCRVCTLNKDKAI